MTDVRVQFKGRGKFTTVPEPVRFHVRPRKGSWLSIRIEVFPTLGSFRAAVRRMNRTYGFKQHTRRLMGFCFGVERTTLGGHRTGLCAVIQVPRSSLKTSTLTHEAFHATLRWAERKGYTEIVTA
jgi:hypothetical protein